MSDFLNLTPVMKISIVNLFIGVTYPREGALLAIVDTGYEGFLAVPAGVFEEAAFDELQSRKRTLKLADGSTLSSEGAYGTIHMFGPGIKVDGFIETYSGLEEAILGVEGLKKFRLLLDYCLMRVRVERCPQGTGQI